MYPPTVLAFDAAQATEAYLAVVSGAARASSNAYFEGGYVLDVVDVGVALAVAALLLYTRISANLRTWLEARIRLRTLQVIVYSAVYLVLTTVLTLPLTIYRGFVREHAYGLATQTFGSWFGEQMIDLGVSVVLFSPFLALLYLALRRAPRTWWLWGTGLSGLGLALLVLVSPVFIAPLFNTYTPLPAGPLRDDILLMAEANGVPADDVFVVDTSRQSSRITANVSGLLGTTRISMGDTLLSETTPGEVRAVMAHEIGHYALGHVYEVLLSFTLVLLAGFAFVNSAFGLALRTLGRRWGVRGIDDVAGLPLFSALLALYLLAVTPVIHTIIRTNEAEADLYGLNAAREPDGFAAVAMRLSTYRKLEPGRIEEALMFDHPSGRSRVQMAMRWKAAQLRAGATDVDPATAPLVPALAEAMKATRHGPAPSL